MVVLARELGLSTLELSDVQCESLLPEPLACWEPSTASDAPPLVKQLAEQLQPYDALLTERVNAAIAEGQTLTHLSCVDLEQGTATIGLVSLPSDSRVARCEENENIIEILSDRYTSPMTVQGPGAGPGITASGLFADLLAVARTLVEATIPRA